MDTAATGSGVLIGLGREQQYGVPGSSGLLAYRAILPASLELAATEGESGQVNQSGFLEPGVPGARGGEGAELGLPLSSMLLLEFFEHICGGAEKTVLEAGPPAVYKYTFIPTLTGADTSFYGLYSNSVERSWSHGIKFEGLEMEIGDNEEIPVRLKGVVSHGTRLGAAAPAEANTGTYTAGPHLRGVLRDPSAGAVHLQVSAVAGGLKFKVDQTDGVPAFAGPEVAVVIDPVTGLAAWQNLQGPTGQDLGIWDEGNKDPLEVIFPGAPADHADLEVGDTFTFAAPGTWEAPSLPRLTGFERNTSAHWMARFRSVGAPAWIEKRCRSGKVMLEWPLSVERGNGSRYPFALLRGNEILKPTVEVTRALTDDFFLGRVERSSRIEGQLAFDGRQIGTGAHREGLGITYASLRIEKSERPAKDEKIIEESLSLVAETNADGDPPVTIEVITTRDWTPAS